MFALDLGQHQGAGDPLYHLGLARSEASAEALAKAGAGVHRGSTEDLDSLRRGALAADGVIHLAFNHDFSTLKENCETDRRAIEALGEALKNSDRPLVVTSGLALLAQDRVAVEDDPPVPVSSTYPRASEVTALSLVPKGVRASIVRLPQVHDTNRQGLGTYLVTLAREKGVSAYVGEGRNRWAAVHRLDATRLYRLVLEQGAAGGRYHAVAEEGIALKDIAAAIGRRLDIPALSKTGADAEAHFGWLASFAGMDLSASSAKTQALLGWKPEQTAGLIYDIDHLNISAI